MLTKYANRCIYQLIFWFMTVMTCCMAVKYDTTVDRFLAGLWAFIAIWLTLCYTKED